MQFSLRFTHQAKTDFDIIKNDPSLQKQCKAVRKALSFLEINPRHPGLNTHKYTAISGANGEEIFEAYAENHTPDAYRIFWHYGVGKAIITIISIIPHP